MHGYIGGKRGHVTFSSRISSEGLMNITAADVDIMAAGEFGGEGIMIGDDSQVNIMGDGVAEGQRGHVKFTSGRIASEGLMNITASDVEILTNSFFGGHGMMVDNTSTLGIFGSSADMATGRCVINPEALEDPMTGMQFPTKDDELKILECQKAENEQSCKKPGGGFHCRWVTTQNESSEAPTESIVIFQSRLESNGTVKIRNGGKLSLSPGVDSSSDQVQSVSDSDSPEPVPDQSGHQSGNHSDYDDDGPGGEPDYDDGRGGP